MPRPRLYFQRENLYGCFDDGERFAFFSTAVLDHSAEAAGAPARGKTSEAMDALLVLGYTRAEAQKALSTIDIQALSIEDIIKEALKKLMKQ